METDYGFLECNVGDVCKREGIDPSQPMPFETRMALQNAILDHCEGLWAAEKRLHFFTDRTPIDFLMYTTADLAGHICLTDKEYDLYMDYRQRCFDATQRYFGALFVIQPGIPIEDPGDKPTAALDRSYIEHLNSLAIGLLAAPEMNTPYYIMQREVLDLDERVSQILRTLAYVLKRHSIQTETVTFN